MAEATMSDGCDGLVLGFGSIERFDSCAFRELRSEFDGVAGEDVVIPPGSAGVLFCD
jgi:hypothetical protein